MATPVRLAATLAGLLIIPANLYGDSDPISGEDPAEPAEEEVVLEGREAMQMAIRLSRSALEEGETGRARQMLRALLAAPDFGELGQDERIAVYFYLGQTYNAEGRHREAARMYRRALADRPDLVRIRLELARSLFVLREFMVADYHFRLALAGDLPEPVEANIRNYLRQIRYERRWLYDFRGSVIRNDNINFAPTARQIEFAGLPDPIPLADARSGVGFSTRIFGEYRHPLSDKIRARAGGHVEHTHYSDSRFHQSILAGYTGPQFLIDNGPLGDSTIAVLFQAYRRWLSFHKYNTGYGPALEYTAEPTDRLRIGARVDHSRVRYEDRDDLDGTYTSATVRPGLVLSPVSYGALTLGVAYERAKAKVLRNWQYRAGVSYLRDLPFSFTIGLHPEYRYYRYEGEWTAFSEHRRDHSWNIRTDVLNRQIEWLGFTPVFTYRYQLRKSTIELFEFEQHRIEFSMTRQF